MKKTILLKISIGCFLIATLALAGLVNEIISAYSTSDGITIEYLEEEEFPKPFPPKQFDRQQHHRFRYHSKTIFC